MGQGATQGLDPKMVQSMLGGQTSSGSLPNMQTGPGSPPVFSPQPAMQNMQGQMGGAGGKGGAPQGAAMPPTSVGGMTGGRGWTGMR